MAWLLYGIAILYGVMVSRHFGGNLFPASDAELVADGIGLMLTALATITAVVERKR